MILKISQNLKLLVLLLIITERVNKDENIENSFLIIQNKASAVLLRNRDRFSGFLQFSIYK